MKKFKKLIESFEAMPGIGKKSATRLAYSTIFSNKELGINLINSIEEALRDVRYCTICGGISEDEICDICVDEDRSNMLCLVENAQDILIIEETSVYKGTYFVFPAIDNEIFKKLEDLIDAKKIGEIVFAFPPSISSDSISYYIENRLEKTEISFTRLARGVPTGISLENVDNISLSEAIQSRTKI